MQPGTLKDLMSRPVATRPLGVAVQRLAIMFGAFSLLRLWFFLRNLDMYAHESATNTLSAFVHGLRFDASSLCTVNAPLLVLAMLPLPQRWTSSRAYHRAVLGLTWLLNIPLLWIELIDADYFRFQGHRSTMGVAEISSDILRQGHQLVAHYWPVVLACGAVGLVAARLLAAVQGSRHAGSRLPLFQWGVLCLLLCTPAMALAIRGSFTGRMLAPPHAFVTDSALTGSLTLNTTFSLLHTSEGDAIPRVDYFKEWGQVRARLERPRVATEPLPARTNVVLFILESISTEHLGFPTGAPVYMPFLRELAQRSVFLDNNLANGRRSIEGATSILAGIPSMMDEPYISSRYQANEVMGLGTLLKRHGYSTQFYHGGFNGSMFFDSLATLTGLDRYFGKSEYPHPEHFDGDWGIYDHHYIDYFERELSSHKTPFFSVCFTLSTHPAYLIPPEFRGRYPKGTAEIHETLGYLDEALRTFFEKAAKEPWYANTVFVLTGDHTTELLMDPRNKDPLGQHRVPLMFFDPNGRLKPRTSHRLTQHVDILPSVVDLLGLPAQPRDLLPIGHSVFDDAAQGLAVNREPGEHWMASEGRLVHLKDDGSPRVEPLPAWLELESNTHHTDEELVDQLKAYVQFYRNGLNDNTFFAQ